MVDDPTTPEDPSDQFLLLVLRYFDGDLNAAELTELSERLRTDESCRQRFMEFCTRGMLVREIFDPERQADLRRETAVSRRPERPTARWRWRRLVGLALAASLLVGVMIGWWFFKPPGPRTIGALERLSGEVRILAVGGEVRSAESGTPIHSGDTVRASGERDQAVFAFTDGTKITLIGDTSVTLSDGGQKSVVVHHGNLAVLARPQPRELPLVLATPTARIQVVGTQFLLEARRDHTDLSVIEGRVRVTRVDDNQSVEVSEGKRLLTRDRADFVVQDIPKPQERWDLDFEDGLPTGMSRGQFVKDGLPPGSQGAVAAVRVDLGKYGINYEIATPESWSRGLFAVHDDSHLHFTYKMERPDWLNVFIIVREPNGPFAGNYLFNKPVFRRPAGQWQTITIPLTEFKKAGSTKGEALSTHLIPFLVLLSSDNDRGLVIDRIWATRGGPGTVEFKDIK
jgi:ferric-dicitrate binding protein FerR (iron transport regulator)